MPSPPMPIMAFIAISFSVVMGGCSTNLATGERRLNFTSEAQEISMGWEADKEIGASLGLYEDEPLLQYVQKHGTKLASSSERPNPPWTFRVVDDPAVNAFAVPGGFIYETRGILARPSNEGELVMLSVRLQRLKLVTVPRAMSLEEFQRSFPSDVPLEALALINRVERTGKFLAGQQVKRVLAAVVH